MAKDEALGAGDVQWLNIGRRWRRQIQIAMVTAALTGRCSHTQTFFINSTLSSLDSHMHKDVSPPT